jgi:hypothetical protein
VIAIVKSNNHNETITYLAMPERQIPVLIDSGPGGSEGYVPSSAWEDKPVTRVRRLLPSFVENMRDPRKRKEIEKGLGAISPTEWDRLRELLVLIDRLNAGDWPPVITSNAEEVLKESLDPILRLSPGGWFVEATDPNLVLRSASGNEYKVEIDLGLDNALVTPLVGGPPDQKTASPVRPATKADDGSMVLRRTITANLKTATFALSEAFTAGLSKTRFVVWWSDVGKKLVPGLYCSDIVTALYALAMWSSGTAGGWAICQKCMRDYPRSRAKQRYCTHKCQVAAAMQRMRNKKKRESEAKSKASTANKKRAGRQHPHSSQNRA